MSRVSHRENRPPRLLVITFHFPPDGSVGGLRWGGMSKYLARRGWEIDIVTAAAQKGPSEPGVHVHHVPRATTLNDRYNGLMSRLRAKTKASVSPAQGPSAPEPTTPVTPPEVSDRRSTLRQAVKDLRQLASKALTYPDDGRGWVLRAAKTARQLIDRNEYVAVITSGPPHSTHVAGALASAGVAVPWWADMRDPWGTSIDKKKAQARFGSVAAKTPHPWLERSVFRSVDRIVANTAPAADHLRKHYTDKLVSFVPNGIDPERLPPRSNDRFEGCAICYVGTLYMGRDLTEIVRAMKAFIERNPGARNSLTLHVAGATEEANMAAFQSEVAAAGLTDRVTLYGRVPGAKALEIITKSHLTLVLAQDQELQVPAKLYECVATGVPTLVVAEPGSAADREARRIGAMSCGPEDGATMSAVIERMWRGELSSTPPLSTISYETISRQMEALLQPPARSPLFQPSAAGTGTSGAAV